MRTRATVKGYRPITHSPVDPTCKHGPCSPRNLLHGLGPRQTARRSLFVWFWNEHFVANILWQDARDP